MKNILSKIIFVLLFFFFFAAMTCPSYAAHRLEDFEANVPIRIVEAAQIAPPGLSPDKIKSVYNLPATGGKGTIAIIDAYDDPTAEDDLAVFSKQFNLPLCTTKNGCFEKHKMTTTVKTNTDWSSEISLDIQWAHAIAPNAKILLVEAKTGSGTNLSAAVKYAAGRADVVAVSMSWGGIEFETEANNDTLFTSKYPMTFFASSGDNGAGVMWPAVSKNVIAVGGTTLHFSANGNFSSETAWNGSGGGISSFENEPTFQTTFGITHANGKRAVPDVSYNADPQSGYSVYTSTGQKGWMQIGGTSAAAPQWAAIRSLNTSVSNTNFYHDASLATYGSYFRDITSGTNGSCTTYCKATKGYDYVTGLGSPLTTSFL